MAAAITLVLSVPLAFVLWTGAKRLLRQNLPLPPGPKGWPIIGNLLQIPQDFAYETYHAWARECGKFIVFPVLFDSTLTSEIGICRVRHRPRQRSWAVACDH